MNTTHYSARPLRNASRGFTLVEVMVVVVIVAILASIAIPSYMQHVIRSNRTAAESFMLQIANKQEQYRLDARTYTNTIGTGGLNLAIPGDVDAKYTITIIPASVTNTTFTISAVPKATQNDTICGTLTLTESGVKTPTPATCW